MSDYGHAAGVAAALSNVSNTWAVWARVTWIQSGRLHTDSVRVIVTARDNDGARRAARADLLADTWYNYDGVTIESVTRLGVTQ